MALRDKIAQSQAGQFVAKRLFGYGADAQASYVERWGGPSKDIKLINTYEGVAYACINAIAEDVGKYQPYFYRLTADGKQDKVKQHELLSLLERPNKDISKFQLFEASQAFMEMTGEFFWYMPLGVTLGRPKEIYLLRPDKVGIAVDEKSGDITGYYLNLSNGGQIPLDIKEILHSPTFNPHNPYRGMSTVQAAINYIQTEEAVSKFTRNFFYNNAGLSGVLSVKSKISKPAWQKLVRQWRERYQGVENAGKVAMIREAETQFTKVGLGLNELDMQALKQMTVDQVLMMFRVPKGILGLESDQGLGRASVETLEYIFAKRTIEPKLCRIDDAIQRLLDRFYPNDKLYVGHENVIPEDKEFLLNARTQAVDKWLTRNEIRDEDGAEHIDGGDQLFVPIQQVPISDAGSQLDTPPAEGKSLPEGKSVTTKAKLTKNADGKIVLELDEPKADAESDTKKKDLEYSVSQKENFRLRLQKHQNLYTRQYKKALKPVLKKQQTQVLERMAHLGKDISSQLFDQSEAAKTWQDELTPVITDLYLTQGGLALEFAGSDDEFVMTEAIRGKITARLSKMANEFNQQTINDLAQTLTEGIANNEALDLLKDRVAEVYDEAGGYRAERVAWTETQDASNQATLDAYQQTGYVTAMTWYANPTACEFCAELDGTTVGLEQDFLSLGETVEGQDGGSYDISYSNVDTPPLHPNCSCTIIPVTEASN